MKTCSKCGQQKIETDYYKRTAAKDGLTSACKVCRKEEIRLWESRHEGFRNKYKGRYTGKYKGRYNTEKYKGRYDYAKLAFEWRKRNPEYKSDWCKRYPEKARELWRREGRKKLATPAGRLNCSLRRSIGHALKGAKANRAWDSLIGYSVIDLKQHLEKLFTKDMSWVNYGKVWEIDHIIPRSAFNYERPEDIDFKKCWALENLRPLGTFQNRSKGKKLLRPFQPSLQIASS